ncbi:MAG: 3-methyl-2-oxobutanoate hydroxymethyltransferase [Rhizobiaceae bacterium]|nr:3-methyl-2-oxobutanoate hydroxymethyltransferase [Rhizobiaceae bacterium]
MKRIYTYGTQPASRNLTVADILANKAAGRIMTQTNCLEGGEEAEAIEACGIDMIICRFETYDAARAGAPNTFITAVAPMVRYATTDEILAAAVDTAGRGADAILTPRGLGAVEAIANEGIPVQGHVGLVPSLSTKLGGLRMVGKTADEAYEVLEQMRRLEEAGAFGCEVECVADDALAEIRKHTNLVVSSIGSGPSADIIFLFLMDLAGDGENPPRHAKAWGDMLSIRKQLDAERRKALAGFRDDVLSGRFPDAAHSKSMDTGEREKLLEKLDKRTPAHS